MQQAQPQARIDRVQEKTSSVLFTAKTVFPFTLFPDLIIITEASVEIIYGLFFFSKERFPIPISSLKTVSVTTNLFFGTLAFEITGFEKNPPRVSFLPKEQALKAKNILNGLIMTSVQEFSSIDHKTEIPSRQPEWKKTEQLEDIGKMGENFS